MPIKASNGDRLIDCLRKAKTLLDDHKVPSKGRVLGNPLILSHYMAKVEINGKVKEYYVYARNKEEAERAFFSLIEGGKHVG